MKHLFCCPSASIEAWNSQYSIETLAALQQSDIKLSELLSFDSFLSMPLYKSLTHLLLL